MSQTNVKESNVDLLTAEQEIELARRVACGDIAARDEFVYKNQRLVKQIAYRYVNSCSDMTLDDLTQAGNIGLIHAVDKFDPDKGYRFSTYATWWIRQAITREIVDKDATVHLPVHVHERLRKVRRAASDIEQQTHCEATAAEIAVALGVDEEEVKTDLEILYMNKTVHIDAPLGDDGDATLGDVLPGDNDTADMSERSSVRADINAALEHLSPREQAVIKLRFGLIDGMQHTLDEVGAAYGVTRERVRQIINKSICKLRRPAIIKRLKDVIG